MIEFVAVIILVVWFFLNAAYTDKVLKEVKKIRRNVEDIDANSSGHISTEKSTEGKT